jgi:hypothetical protein
MADPANARVGGNALDELQSKIETLSKQLEFLQDQAEGLADGSKIMLSCLNRIATGKSVDARVDAHKTILSLAMVSVS